MNLLTNKFGQPNTTHTQMKLKEAIYKIETDKKLSNNKDVVAISYEDGSFYKFNYRLDGETEDRFVDLYLMDRKMQAVRQIETWLEYIDNDSEMGRECARERITQAYHIIINHKPKELFNTDYVVYDRANDSVLQDSYGRVIIFGDKSEADIDCRGNEEVIKCTELPNHWKEKIINHL